MVISIDPGLLGSEAEVRLMAAVLSVAEDAGWDVVSGGTFGTLFFTDGETGHALSFRTEGDGGAYQAELTNRDGGIYRRFAGPRSEDIPHAIRNVISGPGECDCLL